MRCILRVVGIVPVAAALVGYGCSSGGLTWVEVSTVDSGKPSTDTKNDGGDHGRGDGNRGTADQNASTNSETSTRDAGNPSADSNAGGSGLSDAGWVMPAGGACTPRDVSTFAPSWRPPVGKATGKCTPMDISQMTAACFTTNASGGDSCTPFLNAFKTAHMDCYACLITPNTAAKLGPLVVSQTNAYFNVAGCYALMEGNSSAGGCGAKLQSLLDCASAACDDNCPLADATASAAEMATADDARSKCHKDAEPSVCKPYNDAFNMCSAPWNSPLTAPADLKICELASTDTQDITFSRYAEYFCGG